MGQQPMGGESDYIEVTANEIVRHYDAHDATRKEPSTTSAFEKGLLIGAALAIADATNIRQAIRFLNAKWSDT